MASGCTTENTVVGAVGLVSGKRSGKQNGRESRVGLIGVYLVVISFIPPSVWAVTSAYRTPRNVEQGEVWDGSEHETHASPSVL